MNSDARRMILRPPGWAIALGLAITAFGVLFGLSGLAEPDDMETLVTMAVAGLVFASLGFSLMTASATITPEGVRYRNGVILRRVPAAEIESIEVGPGSGAYYSRIALIVNRHGRRPVRLTAVQGPDTERGRREFDQRAAEIAAIVGLS